MATIVEPVADRKASERKFYSRMALFLVAVVFIGFAPSFYLKGIVPPYPRPNPTLTPAVVLHGTVFTLWMAVLVAQTQLIAARKHEVHMRLGKLAMVLAILIVPIMYLTAVWQVARANQPPFTDPLTWTIVPLATIVPFAILVWQGWVHRRNAQWHKRAMIGGAIVVVAGPGIGRFPIFPPTLIAFTIIFFCEFLLFVPLIVWDRRTIGKIHPATKLGLSMLALVTFIPLTVFWTGADWASVAAKLPGVGG
jgi:cytochrome bd-type quinol oxidase subunit 2